MDKPIDLPKMFEVSIRVRCDCDRGEILTESIMLPWDTPTEHTAYMITRAIEMAKLEAKQHLTRQKK